MANPEQPDASASDTPPNDPYSPLWAEFNRRAPAWPKSLGAAAADDPPADPEPSGDPVTDPEPNPADPAPTAGEDPDPDPASDPDPDPDPEPAPKGKGKDKPPPATPTVLDGVDPASPDPEPPKAPEGDWPEDWRDIMAGGDEKIRKRLDRFTSPNDVWGSFIHMEASWKRGDDPDPFPAEGTEKEQADWREANGIPDDPAKYADAYEEDFVVPEGHEDFVKDYLKLAHAQNRTPEEVAGTIKWYADTITRDETERAETDEEDRLEANKTLGDEWGADEKKLMTAIVSMLDSAPEGLKQNLLGARLASGRALGNDVDALRWLATTALRVNPAATLVPAGDGDPSGTVESRLSELEKMMEDRQSDYYKGAQSENLQKEYRDLIDARNAMQAQKNRDAA